MFTSDYNKVFYSQQAFVFRLLKIFCNVHNHIVAFFRRKNLFRLKKKITQLKIELLEILRIFFSMKEKKIIIKREE